MAIHSLFLVLHTSRVCNSNPEMHITHSAFVFLCLFASVATRRLAPLSTPLNSSNPEMNNAGAGIYILCIRICFNCNFNTRLIAR